MTRAERNAAYRKAGAPGLQDTDDDPTGGMPRSYCVLMTVIGVIAVLAYVAAILLNGGLQ